MRQRMMIMVTMAGVLSLALGLTGTAMAEETAPGDPDHVYATSEVFTVTASFDLEIEIATFGPDAARPNVPTEFITRLTNDGQDGTPDTVRVRFEIDRPDLTLEWCDQTAHTDHGVANNQLNEDYTDSSDNVDDYTCDGTWNPLSLDPVPNGNGAVEGWFGPAEGFPLPEGYRATTLTRATFDSEGDYTSFSQVIGLGNNAE